jgi:signal transduction histidine kinase
MTLVRGSRELGRYAASMGEEAAVEPGRPTSTEFAQLARELSAANRRLADARDRMEAQERSRRELIAWMSHDLRTPLAGIRAMAESLEDGMVDDEHRYFRQIRVQANRLNGMVDDLFELSRINSGSLELAVERVSLYDVVSDTVAELGPVAQARQVELRGETAHDDLVVQGDPRELSRVVGNLVMNAIQQSLPGGRIVISAHRDSGNLAVLSVEDTAGGIPEDDLPRVFDAGWRSTGSRTPRAYVGSAAQRAALGPDFPAPAAEAEPAPAAPAESTHDGGYASGGGGAGLGLAIVRGIVRADDGDVTVQNVDGGCRFDVILPHSKPVSP